MTVQLDLFGTAAPAPARRPAKPDTALLLAMSADHIAAPAAPAPTPPPSDAASYAARWREARGEEIAEEQAIAEAEAEAEEEEEEEEEHEDSGPVEGFTCTDCGLDYRAGGHLTEDGKGTRCHWCQSCHTATPVPAELFALIEASYSADTIAMKGTTRTPFRFDGAEWVYVSGGALSARWVLEAYRIAPDDGTAIPYSQTDFAAARARPHGFYHGMAVKVRGEAMQLVGPPRAFREGPPAAPTMF